MNNNRHTQARRNLTQDEFKLFARSFPSELSKLSRRRLNQAILKAERILKKYLSAKKRATKDRAQLLDIRLKNLSEARERFSKKLERLNDFKASPQEKTKKSLTEQPKRRVDLHSSAQDEFKNNDKRKNYSKQSLDARHNASPGRAMSKRIAGYMKARTRKGQVAQDRLTSAKAK